MNVTISEAAIIDIFDLGAYIAMDNVVAAKRLITEIMQACYAMGDTPVSYPLHGTYDGMSVRRKVYKNYLIFFHQSDNMITVVHVFHGARDIDVIFSEDA